VGEYQRPGSEHRFGEVAIAANHLDGKDLVDEESVALARQPGGEFVEVLSEPWR